VAIPGVAGSANAVAGASPETVTIAAAVTAEHKPALMMLGFTQNAW
jgi:hypothetical protein